MMMNTSTERVGALIELSDAIYPAIDEIAHGEQRSRRMLRLGIAASAHGFQVGTLRYAGDYTHRFLVSELAGADIATDSPVYSKFPQYQSFARELPASIGCAPTVDPTLDRLAIRYADVERATVGHDERPETNARHAIHLTSLVLPYAAEYYPDLEQSKLTLYSLLHDIVEAYSGDVPSIGASDDVMQQKHLAEMAALKRIGSKFGATHPEIVKIIEDYELLQDDEARFVKVFDKLDPGFTHLHSDGRQLIHAHNIHTADHFMTTIAATSRRVEAYGMDFPDLLRDLTNMHERIANQVSWPNEMAAR